MLVRNCKGGSNCQDQKQNRNVGKLKDLKEEEHELLKRKNELRENIFVTLLRKISAGNI